MKIDFTALQEALSEDEREELELHRTHIMRFKWLADECFTWDEIIAALKERIQEVEELKAKGAQLLDNNNDHIFYEIPSETLVYATLTTIRENTHEFRLDDGTLLTASFPVWAKIPEDRISTRVIILVSKTGEVTKYTLPIPEGPQPNPSES